MRNSAQELYEKIGKYFVFVTFSRLVTHGFHCHHETLYHPCVSESVTVKDMRRISERLMESKPALAGYGDLTKLPSFKDVEKALVNDGKLSSASRFFLFR